jgi:DNA invertase Pin-like site-specific DNA recombinase
MHLTRPMTYRIGFGHRTLSERHTQVAGKFVSYLRVSTVQQGRSGLGLEAQRQAVVNFLNGGTWTLLREFVEVETGKANDRPQLAQALELCRLTGATLVVAKLDRLARDAEFLLGVVRGTGEAGVVFCDLPTLPAGPVGKFMLTQMAAVAELEAGLISQRTKAALAAAKARGVALGGWRGGPKVSPEAGLEARRRRAKAFADSVGPTVRDLRDQGFSLREVAAALMERGIRTPRNGTWTANGVANILRGTC